MKVLYFLRNHRAGISINKVMKTVSRQMTDKEEVSFPDSAPTMMAIIKNIHFVLKHRDKAAIHQIAGGEHYAVLGLLGYRSILTVHDTVSIDFGRNSSWKRFILKWLWYRMPLYFATRIVCISDETRKSIQRFTNRQDVLVIHNAVDPSLVKAPYVEHDLPVILMIGTNPNKNLLRTFEALKGLKCRLSIIGELTEEQLQSLQSNQLQYENKWGLSDEEIMNEYRQCDMVSFISLFEGFGMIIVEANKVGRPVICSNIPVLREVAGDAALFVDPTHVGEMRDGFVRLLFDSNLRRSLIEKGFVNAERFDAETIGRQWLDLYNSMG